MSDKAAKKVLTPLELDILQQAKSWQKDTEGEKARKLGPMKSAMDLFGTAPVSKVLTGCELPLSVDELVALRFIGQTIKKPTADNVKTYALLRGDLKDSSEVTVTMSKVDENLMGSALPADDDGVDGDSGAEGK